MPFPEGGLVYDYSLDDGGASRIGEEEEEEEKKKTKVPTHYTFLEDICSAICSSWFFLLPVVQLSKI